MPVLVIARLALKEASRRRLLLAVALLTLVVVGFTAWGMQQLTTIDCREGRPCSPVETRAVAAVLLILVSFMFSSIFTLGAVFVTAPAVSAEVESGVVLGLLPRPIRRSDLVVGKWLGLGLLVCGYSAVTMALQFLVVQAVVGYAPPHPLQAIAFLAGEALVMLTFTLLLSTRLSAMTAGVISVVLFGLVWMGGIARAVGIALQSDVVRDVGAASSLILPTDGLWRGALYHLQPSLLTQASGFERMMSANPFFTTTPPSPEYLLWSAAWTAAVLGLAVYSFQRREL